MKCLRVRGETRYIKDRRPCGDVYSLGANPTMSATSDFAVSFVSLEVEFMLAIELFSL